MEYYSDNEMTTQMKIYLIAGEASGDLYGGQIIKNIKSVSPDSQVRYWGGDEMLKQSPHIVKHIRETSIMGFVEVLKNIKTINANINLCKRDILEFNPDHIIFIDYPGFNLRIAEWAKKSGFSTVYYIAPKVWAWKESRVKKLRLYIDHLYVIFPFEKEYFHQHGIHAKYYGSPLVNRIKQYQEKNPSEKTKIVLMPGSRKQEIKRHLPLMLSYVTEHPKESFILPVAQGLQKDSLPNNDHLPENLEIVTNSWEALNQSKFGIISSGTATLEAMLFNVPQIVIYKTNMITYQIARRVVKLNWISLVNIIANKEVVKELIQEDASLDRLESIIIEVNESISKIKNAYSDISQSLSLYEDPIHEMVKDLLKS